MKLKFKIDVLEEEIIKLDKGLLGRLLIDRSTRKNIIWATTNYEQFGVEYNERSEIREELITGIHNKLIQPRVSKAKSEQLSRTRDKAEVFTPSWVCNEQNNLIDNQWFGKENVFNTPNENGWTTNYDLITFENPDDWMKYVDLKRLEISCGEAPYLVSRYDTVTGKKIAIEDRIGLLDRKLRVVNENAKTKDEWYKWAIRAIQSIYAYEYQGDNLLLARENILLTFIEYAASKWDEVPSVEMMNDVAKIISWNIWQMDGLKYVVPMSCHEEESQQLSLFDIESEPEECFGCKNNNIYAHNGIYCKIYDWRDKSSMQFVSLLKGGL